MKLRLNSGRGNPKLSKMNGLIFGIDSATLTLPLDRVTFPNYRLSQKILSYIEDTGEELPIREYNSEKLKEEGISTYYALQRLAYTKEGQIDVLRVTINAKQLKKDYLKGITPETIEQVYNYHISKGYFYCTYEDFLSGWLTDVDFKIDLYYKDRQEVINQFDTIRQMVSPKLKIQGESVVKVWNEPNNKGLEFYRRKGKIKFKGSISPKHQNTRIYLKGLDLLNSKGSYEFYKHHLEPYGIDAENVLRVETWGGKNAKQFQVYGIENNDLRSVLQIDLKRALPMFQAPISTFLDMTIQKKRDKTTSIEDVAIYRWLSEYIKEGVSLTEAIDLLILDSQIELTKQNKYKKRRKYEEVYFKCHSSHGTEPVQLTLNLDTTFKKTFLP